MFGFKARRQIKEIDRILDTMRPEKIEYETDTVRRVHSALTLLEFRAKNAEAEVRLLKLKYEPTRERIVMPNVGTRVQSTGAGRAPAANETSTPEERPVTANPGFGVPYGFGSLDNPSALVPPETGPDIRSGGGGEFTGGGASGDWGNVDSGSSSSGSITASLPPDSSSSSSSPSSD